MSAGKQRAGEWSRLRWCGAVLCVFALQLAALWILSAKPLPGVALAESRTRVSFVWNREAVDRLLREQRVEDPTLFAKPGRRGFSGAAWLSYRPPARQPVDWRVEPRFLDAEPVDAGALFAESLERNAEARMDTQGLGIGALALEAARPSVFPAKGKLIVSGGLAGRRTARVPEVPPLEGAAAAPDTRVDVTVSPMGHVFSARVDRGFRGSEPGAALSPTDRKALELAGKLKFAPLSGEAAPSVAPPRMQQGTIVFQWAMKPAPSNANTEQP